MYALVESVTIVFATLVVAGLFFLVAVIFTSIKEVGISLGNTSVGAALFRPLTFNRWRPAGCSNWPIKFDSVVPVPTQNSEVHMKEKWHSFLFPGRDDPRQEQQSVVGASKGPESAVDASGRPESAVGAIKWPESAVDASGRPESAVDAIKWPESAVDAIKWPESAVGASKGPESALHPPDPDSGVAVLADIPPADVSLLDKYREQVSKRSAGEYTILKVGQILQSDHIRALPRRAKQGAILAALEAAGVKLPDVIDDAMQRKEVLANADCAREKCLREFETRKEQANGKLQAMVQSLVAEYDARIQFNNEEVGVERDKFAEWRRAKVEEEQRIDGALSFLVDKNAPSE
jgi:hypothetical protein